MKRRHILISVFIFTIAFSIGCSDYLDVQPDNRLTLDSPDKIKRLLTRAYNLPDYYSFAEALSDNVDDKGPGALQYNVNFIDADAWKWADSYRDGVGESGSPTNYWNGCYASIAYANQALAYINSLPEAEQKDYLPYKGEALVLRAYNHFMLVNFFAKHYTPATASSDPGVPYVKEVESVLLKSYKRNMVQEVYDYAEKDLLEALPLIKDDVYDVPKFHFNQKAALAFAVRFYLFKGDWQKVVSYANRVFAGISDIESNLRNYRLYSNQSFEERSIQFGRIEENANLLIADGVSWWFRISRDGSRYELSAPKIRSICSMIGVYYGQRVLPESLLRNWYYTYYFFDVHYFFSKFNEFFQYTDFQSKIGIGHINMPLFTNDEVLLSRAEAQAMLGNDTSALIDLNIFNATKIRGYTPNDDFSFDYLREFYKIVDRYNRPIDLNSGNLDPYYRDYAIGSIFHPRYALPSSPNGLLLLRRIIDARRMEFMQEGLRWFDVRRLNIEVTHVNFNGINRSIESVLKPDDPRQQLPIPQEAVTQGIEQNPR